MPAGDLRSQHQPTALQKRTAHPRMPSKFTSPAGQIFRGEGHHRDGGAPPVTRQGRGRVAPVLQGMGTDPAGGVMQSGSGWAPPEREDGRGAV